MTQREIEEKFEIEEMLKKQIDMLFQRFCQTENIEEHCLLNKELCRAIELFVKIKTKNEVYGCYESKQGY